MGSLSLVLLVLAAVPALFPRRRDALMAGGVYLAVMLAVFLGAHAGLASMNRGEGPAFFSMLMYGGAVQLLLAVSVLARSLAVRVAKRVPAAARFRIAASLLLAFCLPVAAAVAACAAGFSGKHLPVLASVLLSPLVWLACFTLLMPERRFKLTPRAGPA